ncbi:hypothetical protein PVAND_014661 [Polypedilum vanderplanki]|uniref:Uncharacterized protein n=1 Tax=Polypedilum vanderplanki TaxID=319348 RepID=A0A9J6BAC6_POLVA|nr:hypothetical protein PVAND_014661 [Polypedilum vanderplanki]
MMKLIFLISVLKLASSSDRQVTIDCNFQISSGWHIFDDLYTCEVTSISSNIIEPNTLITGISGNHLDGKMNQNVEAVRFKELTVNYFPVGLQKFFPNLIAISILSSHLKEIKQSDLFPFPQLKYLNLYDNDLRIIRNNLFEFTEHLEVIGLHYNDIKDVDLKTFDKLKKLKYLWLIELNNDRI